MGRFHHQPSSSASRRIVIAPDSFKGSATAAEIADAIAEGWREVNPTDELILRPMADGGEGTLDAIIAAVPGSRLVPVRVDGPDDRPVDTHWGLLPSTPAQLEGTGVVELANTSGLGLLDPLRPFYAHTRGFGQAIAAALDSGVSQLILTIGGSASTDGGVGALRALGARFSDAGGAATADGNAALAALATIDLSALRRLPSGGARLLTDVRSPLLGPTGAAHLFGAQKGASSKEREQLEANLAHLLAVTQRARGDAQTLSELPGAGAAGGTGFGLLLWGAVAASGADTVAELIGLPAAIETADVIVTGEGRFDEQTGTGKVVDRVRLMGARRGVPVALVAGLITTDTTGFATTASLSALAGSSDGAYATPLPWARAAGQAMAGRFSL